ncbi:hypothetical protein SDC9_125888 [bioreactor metagenome]|uniref:SH3b domain-containing protein n=1 Tax=bioreactor metagenome TaxID=1076179 RepID=A0A645CPL4_9ZZZZ
MIIQIVHAKMDENGKIDGPLVGDQTGKEILTQNFYLNDSTYLLICRDKQMAKRAADFAVQIARDDHYGYSQGSEKRWTGHKAIIAHGGIDGAEGSFDCATLMFTVYILAGLKIKPDGYTGNLVQKFEATGMFTVLNGSPYTASDDYAEVGALYVRPKTSARGGHVFMALGAGSKAGKALEQNEDVIGQIVVDGIKKWCNVHGGAGLECPIIGRAYLNDVYDIIGVEDGWYKIDYKGAVGYIFGDLVSEKLAGNV